MCRRVAACLGRGDMAQLSRADMKRAVLSFCVWERTPAAKGGGLAPAQVAGRSGREDGGTASGNVDGVCVYVDAWTAVPLSCLSFFRKTVVALHFKEP